MKTQAITLSDETHQLLGRFAAEKDQPISRIVEDALWNDQWFVRFAREQGIEKPTRGKPGRPRPKKEE